jgi:hypothetical protein
MLNPCSFSVFSGRVERGADVLRGVVPKERAGQAVQVPRPANTQPEQVRAEALVRLRHGVQPQRERAAAGAARPHPGQRGLRLQSEAQARPAPQGPTARRRCRGRRRRPPPPQETRLILYIIYTHPHSPTHPRTLSNAYKCMPTCRRSFNPPALILYFLYSSDVRYVRRPPLVFARAAGGQ